MIFLSPALIPALVTLGPSLIVKPSLFTVVSPIVTEPSFVKSMSFANLTVKVPLLFTTPILLASESLVASFSPPVILNVSFSFLVMTLPSSPTNFKPSFKVATSSLTGLPSLSLVS
ncbi:hypothetical protein COI_0191 [Mannheimia haemolytica serotype A2 str. OVINE]|nr:hypothetical protein COI_0191 [Mannheimia haemolytica serotype A2 str. OVINE]EEY11544.1 hypothetical protein COK_2378 [Mannheimia haemolytica serotype A2 str. BOVINE]